MRPAPPAVLGKGGSQQCAMSGLTLLTLLGGCGSCPTGCEIRSVSSSVCVTGKEARMFTGTRNRAGFCDYISLGCVSQGETAGARCNPDTIVTFSPTGTGE